MTGPMPADVDDRLRADYPEAQWAQARDLVAPVVAHGPRLLRCVIHCADGSLEKLEYFARHVEIDPRDLMFWAEYAVDARGTQQRLRDFNRPFPVAAEPIPPSGTAGAI